MNYYEILEVSPNASHEVIKAAYKSLMQRYHPDRNPGNTKATEHALKVGLAYEVLSDPDKRATYNIELAQQSTSRLSSIQDKGWHVSAPATSADKDSQSYWVLWLLIATIALSGWLILSLSKKQQSPESELQEIHQSFKTNQLTQQQRQDKIKRIEAILRAHPEILRKEASERAKNEEARTIPIFIEKLSVNLSDPDSSSIDPGYVLFIPMMGVKVGSFDSAKAIQYLELNKELISRKLSESLAYAKLEELNKKDGEDYLKNIILSSIGESTGTNRYEDYPPSNTEAPGRYGAIDVLLPKSFDVYSKAAILNTR